MIARGPAGHGSVPRQTNVVAHLSNAVAKVVAWTPQLRVNETTGSYFRKLAASASSAEAAKRYRDVLNPDRESVEAGRRLDARERAGALVDAAHVASSRRFSTAGYRYNVIPSEAKATLDVRLHPDEDQSKFLDQIRAVINDPSVEVRWARERYRPAGASRLNTELFAAIEAETKKHYNVDVLPTMSTGASDKAQIRSKGVQCYGIGPALDTEDGAKGSAPTAIRNGSSRPSFTASCGFSTDLVMDVARAR